MGGEFVPDFVLLPIVQNMQKQCTLNPGGFMDWRFNRGFEKYHLWLRWEDLSFLRRLLTLLLAFLKFLHPHFLLHSLAFLALLKLLHVRLLKQRRICAVSNIG